MKTEKNAGGGYKKFLRFLSLLHHPSYIQKLNNFCLRHRSGSWPILI